MCVPFFYFTGACPAKLYDEKTNISINNQITMKEYLDPFMGEQLKTGKIYLPKKLRETIPLLNSFLINPVEEISM